MTLEFCQKLPKVELHAHLNGSLSIATIGKLVRLHKQTYPEEEVPPAANMFRDPKNFDDGYAIFKCAQALVDHPAAVHLATSSVLSEFASDNVLYLELRSTPRSCESKMSKRQYIESIIKAVQEQESEITCKLLISIDRRKSIEDADENVELAVEYNKSDPDVVVGVDLSGDARINELDHYYPALLKAKSHGLKVSLHFAEENREAEAEFVLKNAQLIPDRLGHCTYVPPTLWSVFRELAVPAEICLTSNVKCGSVSGYDQHHLKIFHENELPFCICTDDKGVFSCSSSEEHNRAMELLGLNQEEMFQLSMKSIDFIFSNDDTKNRLRSQFIEKKNSLEF